MNLSQTLTQIKRYRSKAIPWHMLKKLSLHVACACWIFESVLSSLLLRGLELFVATKGRRQTASRNQNYVGSTSCLTAFFFFFSIYDGCKSTDKLVYAIAFLS